MRERQNGSGSRRCVFPRPHTPAWLGIRRRKAGEPAPPVFAAIKESCGWAGIADGALTLAGVTSRRLSTSLLTVMCHLSPSLWVGGDSVRTRCTNTKWSHLLIDRKVQFRETRWKSLKRVNQCMNFIYKDVFPLGEDGSWRTCKLNTKISGSGAAFSQWHLWFLGHIQRV